MIGIPDWSNEPLANVEEIAASNAAIDAEITQFHQERKAFEECERQATQELLAVPSYVERYAREKQAQEA